MLTASPEVRRADVWLISLEPTIGSEIRKTRPCVVLQRDAANRASPTTIVCPLTDAKNVKIGVINVRIHAGEGGLKKESVVVCNQLRAVDRRRLVKRIGVLSAEAMTLIETGIVAILDLKAKKG